MRLPRSVIGRNYRLWRNGRGSGWQDCRRPRRFPNHYDFRILPVAAVRGVFGEIGRLDAAAGGRRGYGAYYRENCGRFAGKFVRL